jgi:hypothetical protein
MDFFIMPSPLVFMSITDWVRSTCQNTSAGGITNYYLFAHQSAKKQYRSSAERSWPVPMRTAKLEGKPREAKRTELPKMVCVTSCHRRNQNFAKNQKQHHRKRCRNSKES